MRAPFAHAVTVYLSDEEMERLKELMNRTGLTMSAIIRRMVRYCLFEAITFDLTGRVDPAAAILETLVERMAEREEKEDKEK
ncbi:MAG: ribbon-helix-helix protein, CopG family [Thermofilaceae archaeon]